jgi:hypothetical protein
LTNRDSKPTLNNEFDAPLTSTTLSFELNASTFPVIAPIVALFLKCQAVDARL